MSASTTRLNLTKPGGGSTGLITPPDIVDVDVLNANFDKIDAAIGAQVVTSTTLPSTPFTGEFVYESDTGNLRVYSGGSFVLPNNVATVADLNALPSAAIEGRTVHVDSLNVDFEAQDGVWVQIGVATVADVATRTTEYGKAGGAYLVQGVKSRRTDLMQEETYWTAYNAGTNPLSPARVAGWLTTAATGRFKGTITTSKTLTNAAKWGISTGPTFDSTDDPDTGFSTATGLFTVQRGGLYMIAVHAKQSSATAFAVVVSVNGAAAISSATIGAVAFSGIVISGYRRLLPGDTVSVATNNTVTSQSDAPADNNYLELVQVGY